jgi:hypothetical protein
MLSPSALAKALGISRQMVHRHERDGKIKRGDGGFDLDQVRLQLAQNLGSKQGGSPRRGPVAVRRTTARMCPGGDHVLDDAGVCANCAFGEIQPAPRVVVECEPQPHGGWLKRERATDDADAPEGSKADLEKKLLAERVEKAQLDNSARKKVLIDAGEASAAWGNAITTARNKALMLPSELAPRLALESDPVVCEEMLRTGIYTMLAELSECPLPHAE